MIKKICRVCGKEYNACKNTVRNPNMSFRWQELACSKECGLEYFKRVSLARNTVANKQEENTVVESETIEDEEVVEEDFEYIFDDNTDELWED